MFYRKLKKDTKEKQAYLSYYRRLGKKKAKTAQTFATWLRTRRRGGSVQTKKQMEGLSQSDAAEIQKRFLRKK